MGMGYGMRPHPPMVGYGYGMYGRPMMGPPMMGPPMMRGPMMGPAPGMMRSVGFMGPRF